ncbi:probable E3 SUMO-protein ligase RNF212 isoform X2 [Hydractinia symbiolongicarpus]|nr:probable E3 SUMO-protein ligase RNF212 isoform X2 [Hydractinia symbiolongicarpus]XP_057291759.1 probable E3 SUMO-protein ligase RNF212 isoform X2 [Hydractinia symbiolongicarpus]
MKPDVQIYFTDIRDVCKGAIKQIQQVQQVAEFQKGHKQRLAMFRKHQLAKAADMLNQAKELDRKYRHVVKENEQLKKFIMSQGYQPKDVINSDSVSTNPLTPVAPKTPQNPITPSLLRSLSNHSLMSINSQFNESPRSSQQNYRSPAASLHPSPMRVNASPSNSTRRSPALTSHQASPNRNHHSFRNAYKTSMIQRNTNPMVTPGRITLRTPPINGKLGPISCSPLGSSPRNNVPNSSQRHMRSPSPQSRSLTYLKSTSSKIAQNLNGRSVASPVHPQMCQQSRTPGDERRPIQLQNPKSATLSRPNGPNK